MDLLDFDRESKGIKYASRFSEKSVKYKKVLGTFENFK